MSIIDRATSGQRIAQSGKGPKRLAPVPAKPRASRKDRAILDDIDAWERERDAPRGEPVVSDDDIQSFGEAFRPVQKPAPQAAPGSKAIAAAPSASQTRSREFAFDYQRMEKFGFITPKVRRSRISEEFRLIKRRLMQRMSLSAKKKKKGKIGRDDRNHVILVTSARPSEGKSFVAMNLALSIIFDEGLNVLLVDGDVARPSMSKILGLRNDLPGLTDLLLDGEGAVPDVLLREKEHSLSYLAAGAMVASATDLFGGDRMETLVAEMAERYADRIIIFDGPPLLASTEPVALAEHVGQIVMVVDSEKTSRSAVDSALDLLETDQNVNLVLNKTTVGNRTEQFGSYYEAYNQAQP